MKNKYDKIKTYIIDTNVIFVAEGKHNVSFECFKNCIEIIKGIKNGQFRISLDNRGFILREYIINFQNTQGIGMELVIWLFRHQHQHSYCLLVDPQPQDGTGENFALFPQDPLLASFDRADRKFVATAIAAQHALEGQPVPIVNATDSDWCNYLEVLQQNGVHLYFICPEQMPREECR
jgi:hypothetical protein